MSTVKARTAFGGSIKTILNWNFDQIAMSHGNVVTSDVNNYVKVKFIKAFQDRGYSF